MGPRSIPIVAWMLLVVSSMIQNSCAFAPPLGRRTPDAVGVRIHAIEQATALHLFMAGSDSDERIEKPKKEGSGGEDHSTVTNDPDDFSVFLQKMSQWPLVESLDEMVSTKDGNISESSSRNPFLSPFSSLLNFEEIISSEDTKDPANTDTALNKEQMDVISSWGSFVTTLQQSFGNETATVTAAVEPSEAGSPTSSNLATDIFQEASNRVESVLAAASTAVSPDVFTSVINQARNVLRLQDDLVAVATSTARDRGLDSFEAAERARNTTDYVASLVAVADQVLRSGYVQKEEDAAIGNRKRREEEANEILQDTAFASTTSKPLFEKISSARAISYDEFGPAISTIAEMGWLSGGIYEEGFERSHELGHSIVAEGISSDVYWMVTDSIENDADFRNGKTGVKGNDIPARTIVVRGFDASDERVDREWLLKEICNLEPQLFDEKYPELLVHKGLFGLTESIYEDLKKYIDWSAPSQKIILTGHSVGGSISILLTLMLARDRGAQFVRDKILRVFTFGSPPTLMFNPEVQPRKKVKSEGCEILDIFGLPASLVYGSVQPWDPIPRLFSPIDGLYPLVDDIGEDGMTLFANGPPRSLRLVARALVEAWEGWPTFRDDIRAAGPQSYQHLGLQHIILPEPVRYLTDRFVNVNVNVPPVDEIVRLSSAELYETLETIFPLDVFELSYLTSGIRGFIHHFYPAYDAPLVEYAQKVSQESKVQTRQEERVQSIEANSIATDEEGGSKRPSWGQAEQWLKNVVPTE